MSHNKQTRMTQPMERFIQQVSVPVSGDSLFQITRMIDNGDESRRIFFAICECASNTPGVNACAIFLPTEKSPLTPEMICAQGDFNFMNYYQADSNKSANATIQALANTPKVTHEDRHYFGVVCVGAAIGTLCVYAPDGLDQESISKLSMLAHKTGVVFERQRLTLTLQHYLDRLQVLNELNQLIASNVDIQRVVKNLAREVAFRFGADLALTFLLDENHHSLEIKGGYGCAPSLVPKEIDITEGFLGQVMRLGGHLSMANLASHEGHNLKFLIDLGIHSINACCLEVKGESLGALLIGFRHETVLAQNDLIRLEEFCQGAAVAIANSRSQERIAAYTERLEELVAQRTSDLAVQTARAEEANHAKSQFLANMSHELRTPLTAIVGYGSVLADGIFGPLNEKQHDALNAITRSGDHLKNLIDDVLNLARIESGKETPEPTRVPVKDLLHQAIKLMQQTAMNKAISLEQYKGPDEILDLSLHCDQRHIHQIIINLMSNAVKYTPKAGRVWISAEKVADKLKICIHDNGVGISKEKMEKLFERFERGEDTYSKSQEGTGIGLNLTRRLVELNGGRIGVESKIGEGSTFWIMMPITSDGHQSVTILENAEVTQRLDGLTALVVDDNLDTCEVLKQILIHAGAKVSISQTVKEGISLIENSPPDIVLTDLAIPGESGVVLIKHMQDPDSKLTEIPIIVLSACAFEADRDAAMNAGASLFMAKPFKPTEVIRSVRQLTINSALGKNRYREQL
jgi:signal transduction histidine kinase/ActR/RegA family two-component response regulator